MKTFDVNTLNPIVKFNVLKALKEFKISPKKIGLCGQDGNFPNAELAAMQIMQSIGISVENALYALNGIPPNGCDNEMGENWNWSRCYDGAMLQYAIEFADKIAKEIPFYEVGLKYPMFKKHLLINKYKLELVGIYEPEWSRSREQDQKTFYEIWQDVCQNYTFSFEKDRMGSGGYAGLVVRNFEDGVRFCKWYLSKKSFYVKDVDFIFNGLGGLGIKELNEGKFL
jgi:hypothetical protein